MGEPIPQEALKPEKPEDIKLDISNLKPTELVYEAAKTHLRLEKDMVEAYKEAAENSDNPRVKEIFQQLYRDEIEHHEELSKLIKAFKRLLG